MAETSSDYARHVDLVFEGGGVKGIGLAGAVETLEEHGYKPQNVAGTSAGAISASLLAAGYSAEELKEIIIGLDYRQFQDRAWEDKVPLIERSLWSGRSRSTTPAARRRRSSSRRGTSTPTSRSSGAARATRGAGR